MNSSIPDRSVSDLWDSHAFSPGSFGPPADESTPPIRHIGHTVDGAHVKRFQFTDEDRQRYFDGQDPYLGTPPARAAETPEQDAAPAATAARRDGLALLCHSTELAVEIGKHLSPRDIVSLYSTSRAFHDAVDRYMSASVRAWIAHQAPEAGHIFDFRLYKRALVADPSGRTWDYQYDTTTTTDEKEESSSGNRRNGAVDAAKAQEVRVVPGLRYLQLVVGRDRCCRDVRAILARNGHRTPHSMHATLLRLWLCLEVPTSAQRAALLRNRDVWTDTDLYNAQLLFVKLGMHFNDPVYGPNTYELLHLMMGQKGLYPLWQLLARRRFTRLSEVLALKVRYDFPAATSPSDPRGAHVDDGDAQNQQHWSAEFFGSSIHGVPYAEIGRTHLEGWGRLGGGGTAQPARHLARPDELVPVEAVARGLELDAHVLGMMMWGHVDWATGENLVPSEDELRLADETVLAAADTSGHWRPRHARKKRFRQLSPAERRRILDEDEDERLRAMAWCGDTDDYDSASEDEDEDDDGRGDGDDEGLPCSLEDEMTRGYIVPPADDTVVVPAVNDPDGWVGFVNNVLMSGLPPDVSGEAALRAEAWQSYHDAELAPEWDWGLWLRQQQQQQQQAGQRAEDAMSEAAESLAWEGSEAPSDYDVSGDEM
ncbi:hypothetical protein MY11210_002674 [Beauveria gryllotalpidicola]